MARIPSGIKTSPVRLSNAKDVERMGRDFDRWQYQNQRTETEEFAAYELACGTTQRLQLGTLVTTGPTGGVSPASTTQNATMIVTRVLGPNQVYCSNSALIYLSLAPPPTGSPALLWCGDGGNPVTANPGGNAQVIGVALRYNQGRNQWLCSITPSLVNLGGGGVGTVTSVAMTVPAGFTVTGSPVTTAGTLAVTLQDIYLNEGHKVVWDANGPNDSYIIKEGGFLRLYSNGVCRQEWQ